MPQGTKIATCCYCGTRAALILTGKTRHELSCQGCGAPLHDLKMMPAARREAPQPGAAPKKARPKTPVKVSSHGKWESKSRGRKKKKRGLGWFLEEAFDAIEDIFD